MTGLFIEKKEKEICGIQRRPCQEGDRDGSDASTSQGVTKVAGHHQKLGERHGMNSP